MRTWFGVCVFSLAVVPVGANDTRENEELRNAIQRSIPHLTIASLSPSEAAGVWEVTTMEQSAVFYVTEDAEHLFAGDLYAVSTNGLINLTEQRRATRIRHQIDRVNPDETITYASHDAQATVVHVFTDVDCMYCQQFHLHVAELNAHGVEVRYLAYPRDGILSESYDKMVSAWCSESPAAAFTDLKTGKAIEDVSCESPLPRHLELGRFIGIEGTPTIVTDSGERIPGYTPPSEPLRRLGIDN